MPILLPPSLVLGGYVVAFVIVGIWIVGVHHARFGDRLDAALCYLFATCLGLAPRALLEGIE